MPRKTMKPSMDKQLLIIYSNIQYECALRGIDKKELLKIFCISKPTLNKKLKNPGLFTVNELMFFAKWNRIPLENLFKERKPIDTKS